MRVEATVFLVFLLTACGQPFPDTDAPVATVAIQQAVVTTTADPPAVTATNPIDDLRKQAKSDDPVTRRRALAQIAVAEQKAGKLDAAARSFATAAAADPEIATFLFLREMEVEKKLDHFDDAAATAKKLVAIKPETTATTAARIELPGLLLRSGDRKGAASELAFAHRVHIDTAAEARLVGLASTLASHGMRNEATAIRMRLLSSYPGGRYTETTWTHIKSLSRSHSPLWKLDFRKMSDLAEGFERTNHHYAARQAIALIKRRFPSRARDSTLRWILANSLFASRRYTEVTRIRPRTKDRHYASLERLRAHAYWRSGRDKEFVKILERLLRTHSRSSEANRARILLGNYYLTDGHDLGRAAHYIQQAIDHGGSGSDGENLWNLAWIHIAAGDDAAALRELRRYVEKWPDDPYTSNALFWTAKLRERAGDIAARDQSLRNLIKLYPYNYYSYRAREILGLPPDPPDVIDDAPPFPDVADSGPQRDGRLAVVDELDAAGLDDEATAEFRRIVGQTPEPRLAYELADRYCRTGSPLLGIRLLNRTFPDVIRHGASDIPRRFWEILYPLAWWPEMVHYSSRHGVDPYLVASIVRQESGFNPDAISSAGAVGLMQIMPKEMRRIARAGAVHGRFSRKSLFKPSTNILFGTIELREKLKEMKGRLVAALAAYNAGEDPVREWLREIPHDDPDFFLEAIPYAETRLYVKSIIRNRLEYERVYGSKLKIAN